MQRHVTAFLLAAMLAAPAAAPAAAQTEPEVPRLTVTGEGRTQAPPDMATMMLGVVSEAETAGAALAANSQSMAAIVERLRSEGIEPRDLQTSNFSVQPRYSQPPRDHDGSQPFEPRIIGYSVSNDLTLRVRELERVGELLDIVVTLGANSISGPSFTLEDPTALEDEARRAAVRDAMRKAQLYAGAAGVTLGAVQRIEEVRFERPQPMAYAAMAREAADSAVPIEGGELTFHARVAISWALGE